MTGFKKEELFLSVRNADELERLGKAFYSQTRIDILNILLKSVMNISEIASELNLPISSTAKHVNVLVEAGLIQINTVPGVRGSQKICSITVDSVHIDIFSTLNKLMGGFETRTYSMPIGNYFDFNLKPPCGIVSDKGSIGSTDSVYAFYDPLRTQAQMLWFFSGWIEYRFPSVIFRNNRVESIQISVELCSEAPGYRMVWPSDLTVEINGVRCAAITLPGDYGDRRGRLNPDWWTDNNTQYGDRYTFTITDNGTIVNGQHASSVSLSDLGIRRQDYLSLRLRVDENARNVGGLNIFGSRFGEFEQNIELEVTYYP